MQGVLSSIPLQATAEIIPNFQANYCMLVMQSARFKCTAITPRAVEVTKLFLQIVRSIAVSNFRDPFDSAHVFIAEGTQCWWSMIENDTRGDMIVTVEYEVPGEKSYASVTLSTTNPTWTGLGLIPGFRGARATRAHGAAIPFIR